jgi:hypothetical protein
MLLLYVTRYKFSFKYCYDILAAFDLLRLISTSCTSFEFWVHVWNKLRYFMRIYHAPLFCLAAKWDDKERDMI